MKATVRLTGLNEAPSYWVKQKRGVQRESKEEQTQGCHCPETEEEMVKRGSRAPHKAVSAEKPYDEDDK